MSYEPALDEALDAHTGGEGTVVVETDAGSASVDVSDVDRLGVRVRGVRVRRAQEYDVEQEAAALPERLRSLPDRVAPVEVDARLGGATLRTRPREIRRDEYFEVDLRGRRDAEVRRYRVEGGERRPADWTMTREGLGRLLDELGGQG